MSQDITMQMSQQRHIIQILHGSSKNRLHRKFELLMKLANDVCFFLTI